MNTVALLALASCLPAMVVSNCVPPADFNSTDSPYKIRRSGAEFYSGMTWGNTAWLTGDSIKGVDMALVDLFDTSEKEIENLHSNGQVVTCYIDAGTLEKWRPDADSFPDAALGGHSPYTQEVWINVIDWHMVKNFMNNRMKLAVSKNCDAISIDDIDCYLYSGCVSWARTAKKRAAELAYVKWFSETAHNHGMKIGLKNALDLVKDVEPLFDFAVNESCYNYQDCNFLLPFTEAGKPIFAVEYSKGRAACSTAKKYGMSMLYKRGHHYVPC